MSAYGFTYRSTMCNPKIYALKFAAISKFVTFYRNNGILLKTKFSLQEI